MMTGIEYAKPVVAIENEFLDSLLRLPKKIQKKTREFLDKFRNDPRSPGINLERVKNSQDGKLYSVRIDQQYRAIVAYQKETGVYLLLYVDNHDDAYTWAVNKCVQVNPHTNTIQVYQHMEETEQAEALRHLQEGDAENSGMLSGATAADTSGATQAAMVDGNAALAKASNAAGSTLAHEETDAHRTRTGTIAEPVASTVTSKNAMPVSVNHTGRLADEYAQLTDDDMLAFGVPSIYIPVMLNQHDWRPFSSWLECLPSDAKVYLQLAAEGTSKNDIYELLGEGTAKSPMLGIEKTTPITYIVGVHDDQAALGQEPYDHTPDGDFREALASYGTQQSFVVVDGEEDLKRILDAPLDKWRVFLHPSQRAYVERSYRGPFRLLGEAGTGKTVVAMHRAKSLASQLVRDHRDGKILFTTFTRNLATDIANNLRLICTSEEMARIDVANLDRFVRNYLHDEGYQYDIWYDGAGWGNTGKTLDDIWRDAKQAADCDAVAALSVDFFKDEWSQVIVPQRITSAREYMKALRRGRGTRLSRVQKVGIWKVAEAYQQLMKDLGACDIDMAMSMAADLLDVESRKPKPYAHVIVDEGQDFSAPAYRVLRAMVGEHDDDIFIVGDARQRIYGKTVVLSHCGINVQGRARRLKINYRTTEEIRSAADKMFDSNGSRVADAAFAAIAGTDDVETDGNDMPLSFDDLEGNTDFPSNDSRSLVRGPVPTAHRCATRQEEFDFVTKWIFDRCGTVSPSDADSTGEHARSGEHGAGLHRVNPRDICVVVRAKWLVDEWKQHLDDDLPYGTYRLDAATPDDRQQPGIRVATMHRVKGLEFDYVIVADVEQGICPPKRAVENATDSVTLRNLYKEERCLIYVALTRARKETVLVGM